MKELTPLKGIHHVTAITSSSQKIYDFFTKILGLRLVKKTVNQDDINTYHLFFADDKGSAGTDMTFFDFEGIPAHQKGTDDIARTSFRVANDASVEYWVKRFDHYRVKHEGIQTMFGRKVLFFEDFDQQQYALFSDEHDIGIAAGEPWHKGPVPDEFALLGLGPIFLAAQSLDLMERILSQLMKMTKIATEGSATLYETGEGGNGASVIVIEDKVSPTARQGYGGVHHVAFRVEDRAQLDEWTEWFNSFRLPNSGFVDRFYFQSLYIRLYPNILFELATDGPGFIDDVESYEILGETLALPPKFRSMQEKIEAQVKPLDTIRSTKQFKKEYFD